MRKKECFSSTLILLAGMWATACFAAEVVDARVVGVVDGDTLTVIVNGRQTTVRVADIDAPEKCQAHGARAKQILAELVLGRTVRLTITGKDGHGRSVAKIENDDRTNVSAEMIYRGAAWVYRKYSDDEKLLKAEGSAQRFRVGLWGDQNPTPPWDWRASGKRCDGSPDTRKEPKIASKSPERPADKRAEVSADAAAAILAPMAERYQAEARARVLAAEELNNFPSRSNGTGPIQTGPRGGRYYINGSGNREYVDR